MADNEIIFDPVDHITTDAIGPPGKRVFYLQAWKGNRTLTLLIEKFQVQSLAVGVEQFLEEIEQRYPNTENVSSAYDEQRMHIQPPVDPLFRIGELGLSYDVDRDMVIVIAREVASGEKTAEEGTVARLFCTRAQIQALTQWGMEVVDRGRPICPYCGQPEEPEGHFCPKKNGHNS
jgi:uncharacterized repeat protein (TIGR03847 family)